MTDQIDIIVENIKKNCPIDQVMERDGFHLRGGHGRDQVCVEHDSLKVDVENHHYYWNSKTEGGDTINWRMRRRGLDFKSACEDLCREFGLPDIVWGKVDPEAIRTKELQRAKEDVLAVAAAVFIRWLWKSPEALDYCHKNRYFTDETIRLARLGYSGSGSGAERKEMANAMIEAGIDLKSPAAIAVMGLYPNGDDRAEVVRRWMQDHGIEPSKCPKIWCENGYVPGIMGRERLVYPFVEDGSIFDNKETGQREPRGGKIVYLAGRGLEDKKKTDEHGKEYVDRGLFNLPEQLVGSMPLYLNFAYRHDADKMVVIEGQADAVSLGQWGYAGAALGNIQTVLGLKTDMLRRLAGNEKHKALYVGLDCDDGGAKGKWSIADYLGPMSRMLKWPLEAYPTYIGADGQEHATKDANDILRATSQADVSPAEQSALIFACMSAAATYVEERCAVAGKLSGAEYDQALQAAIPLILSMTKEMYTQYKSKLAKLLKINKSELDGNLKTKEAVSKGKKRDEEVVYTLGGYLKDSGWLLEYLYEEETQRSSLAWRDPSGDISSGDSVMIDGIKYAAFPPDYIVKEKAVLFPSRLGEERDIQSLLSIVETYIRSNYLLPKGNTSRLMSYWVLLTWLYDCFESTIYLRAMGDAGSGKSELMKRIGKLCYRLTLMSGGDTASTLFRTIDQYRGTVFFEEADLPWTDASNEYVKIINIGAMQEGAMIWRNEKVIGADGVERYQPAPFKIFGPKLFAMRKEYKDNAVATRCLTFQLQARETIELIEAGISLNPTDEMRAQALAIRNLLLRWRLKMWQPSIPVDSSLLELTISARLNQVAGPLLAMAKDDEAQLIEIRKTLRDYYAETILGKSMTIEARVIEAIWSIWLDPMKHAKFVRVKPEDGTYWIKIGDIADEANKIINKMKGVGVDDGTEQSQATGKKKKDEDVGVTAHKVGERIRGELQLPVSKKTRDGFLMEFQLTRMKGLAMRFGVDPDEFKPENSQEKADESSEVDDE